MHAVCFVDKRWPRPSVSAINYLGYHILYFHNNSIFSVGSVGTILVNPRVISVSEFPINYMTFMQKATEAI